MHTNNGMKGLSVRSQRWEMLFWCGFDFVLRPFSLCCTISLFSFSLFDLFLCHTQYSKKLLIAVDALLIRIYGCLDPSICVRTELCFILNFKLEMELLGRKMRHDLNSKRIKCEMIFFWSLSFSSSFSILNNNPKHNFTLIYTFQLQLLELTAVVLFCRFCFGQVQIHS